MKIAVIKKGGFLIPAFESDKENLKHLKNEEIYTFEFTKTRNIKFHRKYFGLINLAYNNLPENLQPLFKNIEHFRKAIQIEAGECDVVYLLDGTQQVEPRSISFANMDNIEFQKTYKAVFDVLIKKVFDDNFDEQLIETLLKDFE